jgi:hypothetical protein
MMLCINLYIFLSLSHIRKSSAHHCVNYLFQNPSLFLDSPFPLMATKTKPLAHHSIKKTKCIQSSKSSTVRQAHPTMGLYHPLDGDSNLKYKLLGFLTPNKKISKGKALAFNWDRCCHLALCFTVDSLPLQTAKYFKPNIVLASKTDAYQSESKSRLHS